MQCGNGADWNLRRMPLDPKQRHKLLMADRTGDAAWITAAIEHLVAADPTVTLDEIEGVLRAAASTAYLVATAEGLEVVVGFAASRRALAEAGMTAEQNRLALACQSPRLNCGSRRAAGGQCAARNALSASPARR